MAGNGPHLDALVEACLLRYEQRQVLSPQARDSLTLWIGEALSNPVHFSAWPIQKLEDIPCLRSVDAFKMGAYIAQLGRPKDPLEWQAMGLDSLAILGMQSLFTLRNPRLTKSGPTWAQVSLNTGQWSLRGRVDQFHFGQEFRWPGWLTIFPGQGWDLQSGKLRWVHHSDRGHDISWQHKGWEFGCQRVTQTTLWHVRHNAPFSRLMSWGILNQIQGLHAVVLLPYGVMVGYGSTREMSPTTKSVSHWRQHLDNGLRLDIPWSGGLLHFNHLKESFRIQWRRRSFFTRLQSAHGRKALSIRRMGKPLDWTFVIGDAQGCAISHSMALRGLNVQTSAGWLTGDTKGMWFGDPLVMRTPGHYIDMGGRGQWRTWKWSLRISSRPSGWAYRVGLRYTIDPIRSRNWDRSWPHLKTREFPPS